MNTEILNMSEHHIKALALIEAECFSTPWTENGLFEELSNNNARFYVALCDGVVAGYIGAHNVVGEVYITNVAVSSSFRKNGIGSALVNHLLGESAKENADFVTLEVRKSNENAIKLYEKTGFSVVGERKDFYSSPREDALLMTKFLR